MGALMRIRLATPADALKIVDWYRELAEELPLQVDFPLEPVPEAELRGGFEILAESTAFWVVEDEGRPIGWYDALGAYDSGGPCRLQGWTHDSGPGGRRRRAQAIWKLTRELLKTSESIEALAHAGRRDLVEGFVLSGFRILVARSDERGRTLLRLEVRNSDLDQAPMKWLANGF